ncbi:MULTISPECIES: hypothetical protein [unclassified Arthrobacter]|uniref:hypothetical protein n=1 Tax=unclassified Arthrobacter TaxID=235627 RepID=UPI001D146CBA|nr:MULTISPECIES: hypothetical protein [unclassified Arthrobacter]MCC3289691.1 hypothetical protein [Arthrobacter sp. zg-Y1110]MCC3300794.1 hypothetical protein [Arthrobacter sp. zg-Y895]UWX84887.1 hypothetical protein N2K99_15765 [Arthrobacter sp. zg-Y1110]
MNRRQAKKNRRSLPGLESDPRQTPQRGPRDQRSADLLVRVLAESGHLLFPFR